MTHKDIKSKKPDDKISIKDKYEDIDEIKNKLDDLMNRYDECVTFIRNKMAEKKGGVIKSEFPFKIHNKETKEERFKKNKI